MKEFKIKDNMQLLIYDKLVSSIFNSQTLPYHWPYLQGYIKILYEFPLLQGSIAILVQFTKGLHTNLSGH